MKRNRLDPQYPQPLITPEQRFQIRATRDFAELGATNRKIQLLEQEFAGAVDAFLRKLPDGYKLHPLKETLGTEQAYALLGPQDQDIGWPLTVSECHERAWADVGSEQPLFSNDPDVMRVTEQLDAAREQACGISLRIDEIHRCTVGSRAEQSEMQLA
ncbi:MAG TPA: hypothetical protein VGD81_03260 [Opitutaceae bacterium]